MVSLWNSSKYALCKHGCRHASSRRCGFAHVLEELGLEAPYRCYSVKADASFVSGGPAGVDFFYGQVHCASQLLRIFSYICEEYERGLPDWARFLLWWYSILSDSCFASDDFENVLRGGLCRVVAVLFQRYTRPSDVLDDVAVGGGHLPLASQKDGSSIVDAVVHRSSTRKMYFIYVAVKEYEAPPWRSKSRLHRFSLGSRFLCLDVKHGRDRTLGSALVYLVPWRGKSWNFCAGGWMESDYVAITHDWIYLYGGITHSRVEPEVFLPLTVGSARELKVFFNVSADGFSAAWLVTGRQRFGYVHIPEFLLTDTSMLYLAIIGAMYAVELLGDLMGVESCTFVSFECLDSHDLVAALFDSSYVVSAGTDPLYRIARAIVGNLQEKVRVDFICYSRCGDGPCLKPALQMCEAVAEAASSDGILVLEYLPAAVLDRLGFGESIAGRKRLRS